MTGSRAKAALTAASLLAALGILAPASCGQTILEGVTLGDAGAVPSCPAGKVATGVTLNLRKRSNGRRYYDGLALRCRTVTQR